MVVLFVVYRSFMSSTARGRNANTQRGGRASGQPYCMEVHLNPSPPHWRAVDKWWPTDRAVLMFNMELTCISSLSNLFKELFSCGLW